MRLYRLVKPEGSTKDRKRIGRGVGSGTGKTSGKGHKGQKCRSGAKTRSWSEGGQMPLLRRLPKRGFKNVNRVEYQVVNVADLARKFPQGGDIALVDLKANKLVKTLRKPVKILGNGEISVGVNLKIQAASKSAAQKITAAGGTLEFIKC